MTRHALALAVGLAVGLGVVRGLAPSTVAPPARAPSPAVEVRLVASGCPDEAERVSRVKTLTAELEAIQRTVALRAAVAAAVVGAPAEWPFDVPEAFTEPAIERAVTDMLAEAGAGRLLDLDCGEYPCVGLVLFPASDAGPDADREPFEALFDGSAYAAHRHGTDSWAEGADGELEWLAVHIAFPAGKLDAAASERVSFRLTELTETFASDLEAAP